jgi:signal peptide peptidase SppA
MSPEDRKQTEQYLNGIWEELKASVSASRDISVTNLHTYADECMSLQAQHKYIEYGLVDSLVYIQDMDSILRMYAGTKDYKMLSHSRMNNVERVKLNASDKVAVLYADGQIYDSGSNGIVDTEVIKTIKKIVKDDAVKALVLRVNSPGGSADASEQIWHAIKTVQAKGLPVVVSMGDYAASGGYYISCCADYIYAEPTTLTGSIGIFGTVPNISKLRENIGLDVDGVTTNKHSALTSNILQKGMNPEERALMQAMVERGYDLFTQRCADGRGVSQDSIKAIGEGRVWLGKDAVKSEEEYTAKIREMIASQLAPESEYRFGIDARKAIEAAVGEIELPAEFLKRWLVATNEKYTEENIAEEYGKMEADLKWHLIKEHAAKVFEVKVEEDDIKALAISVTRQQFAQYGMSNVPDELLENYSQEMLKSKESRAQLIDRTTEAKIQNAIKNAVTLDVKEISTEDFGKLFQE